MTAGSTDGATDASAPGDGPHDGPALYSRGYLRLLVFAALVGVPLSFIAFAFLAAVHEIEHWVWVSLPDAAGFSGPPAWWPVMTLGVAGLLVALVVQRLPGHGGHVPVEGMGGGPIMPVEVPGVVLAAAASLSLGAVVGPEAPLVGLGGGLALLAARWTGASTDPRTSAVLAVCGSAAAISAIFGNPLIAAIIFLEMVGLGRRQAAALLLPCLLSSGVGALVFTGLGSWTGFGIGALSLPGLDPGQLRAADVVVAVPLAILVSTAMWLTFALGRRTARAARTRLFLTTVAAGLLAGCSAMVYALLTEQPSSDVAMSGQATLAALAGDPEQLSTGTLALLVVCKGIAYALCLGVFRGGPVFPALFLGAATGVLAAEFLPGLGTTAGLAMGMAAGATVTGAPVGSILLVVLLLGTSAAELMPVVILAAVAGLIVHEWLSATAAARRTASVPMGPARPEPAS